MVEELLGAFDHSGTAVFCSPCEMVCCARLMLSPDLVNHHLKAIYDDKELDPGATIRSYRIARQKGGREVVRQIEQDTIQALEEAAKNLPTRISSDDNEGGAKS